MTPKKPSFVLLEGQQIPWSVIQMVRRACGGDWDQTMDAFWKARLCKGPNSIVKFVVKGLVKNEVGVRYSLVTSKERENGQMEAIRQWWNKAYTPKPKKDRVTKADIIAALSECIPD